MKWPRDYFSDNELVLHEKVERFVTGDMSPEEEAKFRVRLEISDDLRDLVKEYEMMARCIGSIATKRALMAEFEKDYKSQGKHDKRRRILWIVSSAACLLLIVPVCVHLLLKHTGLDGGEQLAYCSPALPEPGHMNGAENGDVGSANRNATEAYDGFGRPGDLAESDNKPDNTPPPSAAETGEMPVYPAGNIEEAEDYDGFLYGDADASTDADILDDPDNYLFGDSPYDEPEKQEHDIHVVSVRFYTQNGMKSNMPAHLFTITDTQGNEYYNTINESLRLVYANNYKVAKRILTGSLDSYLKSRHLSEKSLTSADIAKDEVLYNLLWVESVVRAKTGDLRRLRRMAALYADIPGKYKTEAKRFLLSIK